MRRQKRTMCVLVGVSAGVLLGIVLFLASGRPQQDLVLITIDTLRADHLPFCGYPKQTAPTLTRLATSGLLFTHIVPTASYTVPSVASIMTGDYPQTHGVRYQPGTLPDKVLTLAEVLSERGYWTAGIVGSPLLSKQFGFGQGFDSTFSPPQPVAGSVLTDKALEIVRARPSKKPFFLWVHYMDPHWPYTPPLEWARRFAPDLDLSRPFKYLKTPPTTLERIFFHNDLPPEAVTEAIGLYDGEIANADSEIGRLLGELDSMGLMAHAVTAVTSDHGESLGEHGIHFTHAMDVYEPSMRVFLILKAPRLRASSAVHTPFSNVNIFPTLLALLGCPAKDCEGRDLLGVRPSEDPPPCFGENSPFHPWYYDERPRMYRFGLAGVWSMVRRGNWKLIMIPGPEGQDPAFELYDLATDPEEEVNRVQENPAALAGLKSEILSWVRSKPGSLENAAKVQGDSETEYAPDLDPQTLDALRGLGYLKR